MDGMWSRYGVRTVALWIWWRLHGGESGKWRIKGVFGSSDPKILITPSSSPKGFRGFGVNPSSNEFRLCNNDEWRSGNHGGRVMIHGYGGGGGDMVVLHRLKGCLDH
uniref:Uncharacterized protein n=1 Tax=Tanacetum cinerariifolium TaxID=118510 RepID=A0A6L2NDN7_TANCI|nr:hypothetical protein [Tanacetum cinerariifolium]